MKARSTWALVVGVVVVVGTGVFVARTGNDRSPTPTEEQNADEIAHVHGLGINPADAHLYAATHHGLYRVDVAAKKARLVGDIRQDTMGFTVAGPDHFLASGHPDLQHGRRITDRRPLLGLIESRNGGRTWRELSLGGEADFHGLVVAHGLVYAWNATSGGFMVSSDKRTWERRSTVVLASFAVDPTGRDHILASGESGLMRSQDGGRTWQAALGPAGAFLAWGEAGDVWAARFEDGAVSRSRDGGATWQSLAPLSGSAEALLRHEGDLYAAVANIGLLRSRDDGETWTTVYSSRRG